MIQKKLILIYFFIATCFSNIANSNDDYKIVVKVNNEIISNYDIEKEMRYLSALNPKILEINEDEIKKIAKQSLIREIIKENEISKFYDVNYESPALIELAESLYSRMNVSSEEEFKIYLAKYDLSLNDVLKKLAIENNWNSLIYEKYKNQINIDEDKIKKNLEVEFTNNKTEKLFLLSEILFTAKNKEDFDINYKKILETIQKKDFTSAASIYSLSDTAKFGGKIGWVSKNDLSKKIYKQISILEISQFTQPFKVATGFLLINLDDIKTRERENNSKEVYNNIVTQETNRQLNQFSTIYFKKVKKQNFIYED
tara:strand:- start:1277 stop:2215 length:939 start_codon:yes stop_codon:yes gene_type:complete